MRGGDEKKEQPHHHQADHHSVEDDDDDGVDEEEKAARRCAGQCKKRGREFEMWRVTGNGTRSRRAEQPPDWSMMETRRSTHWAGWRTQTVKRSQAGYAEVEDNEEAIKKQDEKEEEWGWR
jgi:hypothetical protein